MLLSMKNAQSNVVIGKVTRTQTSETRHVTLLFQPWQLQRRILELIQGFELKNDWRVEAVMYNPATSTVRIVVKQPPR